MCPPDGPRMNHTHLPSGLFTIRFIRCVFGASTSLTPEGFTTIERDDDDDAVDATMMQSTRRWMHHLFSKLDSKVNVTHYRPNVFSYFTSGLRFLQRPSFLMKRNGTERPALSYLFIYLRVRSQSGTAYFLTRHAQQISLHVTVAQLTLRGNRTIYKTRRHSCRFFHPFLLF